jgi:hypothetical protein
VRLYFSITGISARHVSTMVRYIIKTSLGATESISKCLCHSICPTLRFHHTHQSVSMVSCLVVRLFLWMLFAALITGLFPPAAAPQFWRRHLRRAVLLRWRSGSPEPPAASNPVPQNVPPAGRSGQATIGTAATTLNPEAAVLVPTGGAAPGGVWHYTPRISKL